MKKTVPTIVLQADLVGKKFESGEGKLSILNDISFVVKQGDSLSITGPSGSGKSTLLSLCAGLDVPSSGAVSLLGFSLNKMSEDDRAYIRNQFVGFVFQDFQLLPTLTALENVMITLELLGQENARDKASTLLDRVGLGSRHSHYPSCLSGGEQQRVALARAFVNTPQILFADEPTGNLDECNADRMTDLMFEMNAENGTTLVLVTHNPVLACRTERLLQMKGGSVVEKIT